MINHFPESLLFSDNNTWKLTDSCFDLTMDSFDGAEIREQVELQIQSKLEKILSKSNSG